MDKDTKLVNNKRGYLNNDFSFFNLHDNKEIKIDSHHHDFSKVVVFISGKVTYYIEGTAYKLKPWDILLINRDTVHKPVIDITSPYKRMIIWLRPSFLQKHSDTKSNLLACFELAYQRKFNLLRMTPKIRIIVQSLLSQINDTCQDRNFGDELLRDSLLLQFIVYLNRMTLEMKNGIIPADIDIEYDETINKILQYIDTNITEDLSIEKLASVFFLSKYYLMRKFKQHTGYSIHQYVLQKRLIAANQFLRAGQSVITACMESGFHDYANFTRAFKKMYGLSPRKYYNLPKQEDFID
ncbi:AraC family transcriptional regulator [Sporomusa sp.]|uniref:AraC family transcriptional regulator n=1 Tax=Sporomusa sp. TaxID=2078658 RepID=UPI002BDE5245|nr:AraC family transcriptional regulator [Sporomusa sp.]HWR42934.1 AraC family transcriptional regulator [Sporomusa sp.]